MSGTQHRRAKPSVTPARSAASGNRSASSGKRSASPPGASSKALSADSSSTSTLDSFASSQDGLSEPMLSSTPTAGASGPRPPGGRATPDPTSDTSWTPPFTPVGDGLEQSGHAWRDPGSDEVIEVDYARDPKFRRMVERQSGAAEGLTDRDERLKAIAEFPEDREFGLATTDKDMDAWDKRYKEQRRVADLGDSYMEKHACREAAIYTQASLAKVGERGRVVYGLKDTTDLVTGQPKKVRHAWVQLEDGTVVDATTQEVMPADEVKGLHPDPDTKAPVEMFRPEGAQDTTFPELTSSPSGTTAAGPTAAISTEAPADAAPNKGTFEASGKVDPKGTSTGKASYARADDIVTNTLSAEGSYSKDKGVAAEIASTKRISASEGDHQQTRHAASYGQGRAQVSRTTDASTTDEEGTTRTQTGSTAVGYKDGVADLSVARGSGESHTNGSGHQRNASLSMSTDGSAAMAGEMTDTLVQDGATTTTALHGGMSMAPGQATVHAGASREVKDEVSKRRTEGRVAYDSKKGLDARAATTRELGDATTGQTRTLEATFKAGEAKVAAATTAAYEQPDGTKIKTGRSGSMGYGPKGFTAAADATRSAGDDVKTVTHKAGMQVDGQHVRANVARTNTLAATEGDSIASTQTLQVGTDGVTAGHTTQAVHTDDQGTHLQSTGATAGVDAKGNVTGGVQRTATRKGPDGQEQATAGGVAIGSDGKVKAHVSKTKKGPDGKTRGAAASGSTKVNEHGQVEEIAAAASATTGPVTVGGHGKIVLNGKSLDKETGVLTINNGVAGGLTAGRTAKGADGLLGEAGPSAGVNAGIGGSSSKQVHRVLTKEQRAEFERTGAVKDLEDLGLHTMGDWKVGEGIDETSGSNVSAGADATAGGVGVGAGISGSESTSFSAKKISDTIVQIELAEGETSGMNVSMSGGPASLTHGTTDRSGSKKTVQIDLTQVEDPQAVAAYIKKHGTIPPNIKGVTVVAEQKSKGEDETTAYGIAGASASVKSGTSESVETTADGDVIETDEGYRGAGVSLPWGSSHHFNDSLKAVQTNNGETVFQVSSTVASTNSRDAMKALARAGGTYADVYDSDDRAEGKREWSASYQWSEATIARYLDKLRNGEASTWMLNDKDDKDDLISALHAAQGIAKVTPEAANDMVRKAMARFVKEGGSGALRSVRQTMDMSTNADLKLKGDKYFSGAKWRMEADNNIARIKGAIKRGHMRKAKRLYRKTLSSLKERRTAVGDAKKYPELPETLRLKEIDRTDDKIKVVKALRRKIKSAIRTETAIASSVVDYHSGSEMDVAFAGAGIDEHAKRKAEGPQEQAPAQAMGPVRDDYDPEPEMTTEDLVKQELEEELHQEKMAEEAKEDETEKDDSDIADKALDSKKKDGERKKVRRARRLLTRSRRKFEKATTTQKAKARHSYKSEYTDGRTLLSLASMNLQMANGTMSVADQHLEQGKNVDVPLSTVKTFTKLANSNVSDANRAFKKIP